MNTRIMTQHECPTWFGTYTARITVEIVARILGFSVFDVRLLTRKGLLKPLGKPINNATRFYATADIMEKVTDMAWLSKATTTCQKDHADRYKGKELSASDCEKN